MLKFITNHLERRVDKKVRETVSQVELNEVFGIFNSMMTKSGLEPLVFEDFGNGDGIRAVQVDFKNSKISNGAMFIFSRSNGKIYFNLKKLILLPKQFIEAALKDKDITIYGDGSQTRTFCYVDDNIEACLNAFYTHRFINDVINVGNDKETSILELAQFLISNLKSF